MKNKVLTCGIVLQAVLIVLLLVYIWWMTSGKPASPPIIPVQEYSQTDDVVISNKQMPANKPEITDIPVLEDLKRYISETSDPAVMRDILNRRLENVGIRLANRYLDLIGAELGNEYFVSNCEFQWVQYKNFGILVLKRPTAEQAGDTCYVFENNCYKGYIAHFGYINTENCFSEFEDELWLTASRFGHGTGFSCEERFWYRLTATGLDCELRYTQTLRKNPLGVLQVDYAEEFVEFTKNEYGNISVITKWIETLSDGDSGDIYSFKHEGETAHSLNTSRLWETYDMATGGDYMRYLIAYSTEFENLIQNGSPTQKEMVQRFLQTVLEKKELDAFYSLSEIVQWYEERCAAQSQPS